MVNLNQLRKLCLCLLFVYVGIGVTKGVAQLCVKSDCESLGYNSTATACQNHFNVLICPFDDTKAVCGGEVKAAGSGIAMFYYNGKLYSATIGNIGGIDYPAAGNGCTAKGYRLPTSGEAYRVSALRSKLNFTLYIDTHGSSDSRGLWLSSTCSDGHQVAYLDGMRCKADTFRITASLCVKEL